MRVGVKIGVGVGVTAHYHQSINQSTVREREWQAGKDLVEHGSIEPETGIFSVAIGHPGPGEFQGILAWRESVLCALCFTG